MKFSAKIAKHLNYKSIFTFVYDAAASVVYEFYWMVQQPLAPGISKIGGIEGGRF